MPRPSQPRPLTAIGHANASATRAVRMRHPNRTQTLEAVGIAKHLLGKVGDQLDAANPE